MGKKKIVLDTNIIISAFGWEGNSRELLRQILNQEHECILSVKIVKELKKVLDYPKFKFTSEQKKKFLEIVLQISTVIETKIELDVCDDKNDNIFLECSIEGKADYIITGDDDLLRLKKFNNVEIISVKDFLKK